jgi:hypothetical protein
MEKEEVLKAVEKKLRSIPGVVDIKFLDPELKEELTRLEMLAEQNGACMGLMPFINRGVWEALAREVSLIVIGNASMIVDRDNLLYILDQKGQVMGEYVIPGRKQEILAKNPDARFLSDDFVIYPVGEIHGEPYFLISEVKFQYLDDVKGVTRVTSGSISTMSDDFIRNSLGYTGPKVWTHLVGFDIILD